MRCNIVDIFCTFRNCNVSNFISFFFFHGKVFCYISVHNLLFYCFWFFRKQVLQIYKHLYPQSYWSMQLTVVSSGSQLLLSNSLLFFFKSKNQFILEIYKIGHLRKNIYLVESEIILHNSSFFTQHVCNQRLWMENHWWNVSVLLKNKSWSHFLGIFSPEYSKSLKLRTAVFEMQLSHGVLWFTIQTSPIVCAKTVPSLLRESM